MRSPITRLGGKYYLVSKLLPFLKTEHSTYVEAFGGAAHLLFAKDPSPIEVLNDIDGGLVNFFRVLRDPEKAEQLKLALQLTPYSREEFYDCMNNWETATSDVEKARMYWVSIMQSFGGVGVSFGASVNVARRGMSQIVSKYLGYIDDKLPAAVERIRSVQIEHLDWRECIEKYDRPTTLFYLDPPYVSEKRTYHWYDFDMSADDHAELVNTLNQIKGKVILSGYSNDIYSRLDGFTMVPINKQATRVSGDYEGERLNRQEVVWTNFDS